MKDAATRLFLRYRARRDGAALARLFDMVAPEMLSVSRFLAPDVASAEDLVQATFVVALERPDAFDPSREVKPWLYGILARQAAHARRAVVQSGDALAGCAPQKEREVSLVSPIDDASLRESRDSLRAALALLPEHYRAVLDLYLNEGLSAPDIALRLGDQRSAGHIRVQIGRGLEQLRTRLPRGFGLGAVATGFVAVAPRGHAAIRSELVRSYAHCAVAPSVGAWISWALSLLAMKLTLVAVVSLVLVGWVFLTQSRDVESMVAAGVATAKDAEAVGLAAVDDSMVDPVQATDRTTATKSRDVEALAELAPVLTENEGGGPVANCAFELSVTDGDGNPIPGAEVRTHRCSALSLQMPRLSSAVTPVHSRTAGPDGRVLLEGLVADHYLVEVTADGYCLRTARVAKGAFPTPRLRPHECLMFRVGLAQEAVVAGVVRDPRGMPMSGVEVSMGDRIRTHAPDDTGAVIVTKEDGRFELRGLPRGDVEVRAKGEWSLEESTVITLARGQRAEWNPVLDKPAEIVGRLVDADGSALAHWTIRSHLETLYQPVQLATWGGECVTSSTGEFRMQGVEPGLVTLSARSTGDLRTTEVPLAFVHQDRRGGRLLLQAPTGQLSVSISGRIAFEGDAAEDRLGVELRCACVVVKDRVELGLDGEFTFLLPSVLDTGCDVELAVTCESGMGDVESRSLHVNPGSDVDVGNWLVVPPGVLRFAPVGPSGAAVLTPSLWTLRRVDGVKAGTLLLTFPDDREVRLSAGRYEMALYMSSTHSVDPTELEIRPGQILELRPDLEERPKPVFSFHDEDGVAIQSPVRFTVMHFATGCVLHEETVVSGATGKVVLEPQLRCMISAEADDGRSAQLVCTGGFVDRQVMVLR